MFFSTGSSAVKDYRRGEPAIDGFLNSYLRSINANAAQQKNILRVDSLQTVLNSTVRHNGNNLSATASRGVVSQQSTAVGEYLKCLLCPKAFPSQDLLALHISNHVTNGDTLNGITMTKKLASKVSIGTAESSSEPKMTASNNGCQLSFPTCLTALTMDGKCVIIDGRSLKELNVANLPRSDAILLSDKFIKFSRSNSISVSGQSDLRLSGDMNVDFECLSAAANASVSEVLEAAETLGGELTDICQTPQSDDVDLELPCDDKCFVEESAERVSEEDFDSLDNSINWSDLLDSQISGDMLIQSEVKSELPLQAKKGNSIMRISLRNSAGKDTLSTNNVLNNRHHHHQQQPQQQQFIANGFMDSCYEFVTATANGVKRLRVSRSDMFVCQVCGAAFPTDKYLTMHTPIHNVEHPTENFLAGDYREQEDALTTTNGKNAANNGQNTANWSCKICNKVFAQNSNYKNHMRTHSDERPFVCEICRIGFKERYHLKKHQLFKHSSELKEKCRVCGKLFKDSTAVRAHERIHSDVRPYSCKRCGKTFKTSECLWHHENRSKTCTSFDSDTVTAAALAVQSVRNRRSRLSVAKSPSPTTATIIERPRAMTYSGGSNTSSAASSKETFATKLSNSPRTVSLVLPQALVSQIANTQSPRIAVIQPLSSVVTTSSLTAAATSTVTSTSDNKPVKLSPIIAMPKVKVEEGLESNATKSPSSVEALKIVGRKVASKEHQLVMHIKNEPIETETNDTKDVLMYQLPEVEVKTSFVTDSDCHSDSTIGKYTCAKCGKQFISSSGYEKHMQTHEESRPYRCALCDVGFKLKVHLKKHNLYRHSDDKPCACSICGKAFKDSSAVRLHEKIHSSQRPFVCCCGKTFKTKENLWGHRHRGPCEKTRAASLSDEPYSPSSGDSSPAIIEQKTNCVKLEVLSGATLPIVKNSGSSPHVATYYSKRKSPHHNIGASSDPVSAVSSLTTTKLDGGSAAKQRIVAVQKSLSPVNLSSSLIPSSTSTIRVSADNVLPPFETFASSNNTISSVHTTPSLPIQATTTNQISPSQTCPTIESLLRLPRSSKSSISALPSSSLAPPVATVLKVPISRTITTPSVLIGLESRSQSPFTASSGSSSFLTPSSIGSSIILPSPSSPCSNRHVFLIDDNPMLSAQEPMLRSPSNVSESHRMARTVYEEEETYNVDGTTSYNNFQRYLSFNSESNQCSIDAAMPISCWPDDDSELIQIDKKAGPALIQWQASAESLFQEYVNY